MRLRRAACQRLHVRVCSSRVSLEQGDVWCRGVACMCVVDCVLTKLRFDEGERVCVRAHVHWCVPMSSVLSVCIDVRGT
jgi:hypothetical protein